MIQNLALNDTEFRPPIVEMMVIIIFYSQNLMQHTLIINY